MNVIRNTADVHDFGTEVATGCGQICMHARPNFAVQPWLAILDAEDDVNDNLAKGLWHGPNDDRTRGGTESRFQR